MCGISGLYSSSLSPGDLCSSIELMSSTLIHRGPDGFGSFYDHKSGLALAHRRLSILELSDLGSQPMHSLCGRYVITFNGEIYNHKSLRKHLPPSFHWKSSSDTETLVNLISHYGFLRTLSMISGMFAFCIWDKFEKCLLLARDRFGEKPLYYSLFDQTFAFASQLNSILSIPCFSAEIDTHSVLEFFERGFVPSPNSICKGIYKLPPASYLRVDLSDLHGSLSDPTHYWSIPYDSTHKSSSSVVSVDEAIDNVHQLLIDSVAQQSISDVPLGTFLSGGIDSSLVTSLLCHTSPQTVNTFTVGFDDLQYDESPRAKRIANFLETNHTNIHLSSKDVASFATHIPSVYDEPFADASAIPTYLISKYSSASVKVCLSGDGGDETFCGYSRYLLGASIWGYINPLPLKLRSSFSALIAQIPSATFDKSFACYNYLMPARLMLDKPTQKVSKFLSFLSSKSLPEAYLSILRDSNVNFTTPGQISNFPIDIHSPEFTSLDYLHQMMLLDALTYLPDGILVKTDRASMASSLETRLPLLDHKLVEYAWSIPSSFKFRNGSGKWILRKILNKYLPQPLFDGPKVGFSVPMRLWLRTSLKSWADEIIHSSLYSRYNPYPSSELLRMWTEHVNGSHDYSTQLWRFLCFFGWLSSNGFHHDTNG